MFFTVRFSMLANAVGNLLPPTSQWFRMIVLDRHLCDMVFDVIAVLIIMAGLRTIWRMRVRMLAAALNFGKRQLVHAQEYCSGSAVAMDDMKIKSASIRQY